MRRVRLPIIALPSIVAYSHCYILMCAVVQRVPHQVIRVHGYPIAVVGIMSAGCALRVLKEMDVR